MKIAYSFSKYRLGNDALFFGIIFHLCGQVELLRLKFTRFTNGSERSTEQLNALIKRHIYLLNLAEMLNQTISSILIVQLSTSSILMCITGEHYCSLTLPNNATYITMTRVYLNTLGAYTPVIYISF